MFDKKILKRLLQNTSGATAIEYGLIAALVVIAIITAMKDFANSSSNMWDNVEEKYESTNSNN